MKITEQHPTLYKTDVAFTDRVIAPRAGGVNEVAIPELGLVTLDVPVTNGLWNDIVAKDVENLKRADAPDLEPRVRVSWYDAVHFANAMSVRDGLTPAYSFEDGDVYVDDEANGWRLPGEGVWEALARAGTTEDRYGPLDEIAVYDRDQIDVVRTKAPNAFGLYDMIGLVWEWTETPTDYSRTDREPVPVYEVLSAEDVDKAVCKLRGLPEPEPETPAKKESVASSAPPDSALSDERIQVIEFEGAFVVARVYTTIVRVALCETREIADLLVDALKK